MNASIKRVFSFKEVSNLWVPIQDLGYRYHVRPVSLDIRMFTSTRSSRQKSLSIDPRTSNPIPGGKRSSRNRKQRSSLNYKFVDRANIKAVGGSGGKGCISFISKGGKYKKQPDGGHGGNGGYVVLVADEAESSLNMTSHHFRADDGCNGRSQQRHGRNGENLVIRVPPGVIVRQVLNANDEVWDVDHGKVFNLSNCLDEGDQLLGFDKPRAEGGKCTDLDWEHYVGGEISKQKTTDEETWDRAINLGTSKATMLRTNGTDKSVKGLPADYDEVVNTGVKSEMDGMFHWKSDESLTDDSNNDHFISSSEQMNISRTKVKIADLDKPGTFIVVSEGGRGGTGNSVYASKQFKPAVLTEAPGRAKSKPGGISHLELELKLIAHVGLVGFPNAGKSSLLAAISKARPKIAPYPFTTLNPLVGCVEYRDGFRSLVADVPGLIGGAGKGKGRGHDFLRHLERTKVLLYLVDIAGSDGRCPKKDLEILTEEIRSYGDEDMMNRMTLVVANKIDLLSQNRREELLCELRAVAEDCGIQFVGDVLGISAGVTGEGLATLTKAIRNVVEAEEARNKGSP